MLSALVPCKSYQRELRVHTVRPHNRPDHDDDGDDDGGDDDGGDDDGDDDSDRTLYQADHTIALITMIMVMRMWW